MKKIVSFVVIALFVTGMFSVVQGAEKSKASVSKESAKRSAEEEKRLAEERKKVEEKKKDLNGTRWEVTIKPANPKEKETKDVLTFQDHQVRSEYLEKRGYPPTNYTISIPSIEGQAAVWETMKTGQAGTAFVHGEWNKDVMSGTMHEQVTKGKNMTTSEYYFTSSKRSIIAPTAEEEKKASEAKKAPPLKALVAKETPVKSSK